MYTPKRRRIERSRNETAVVPKTIVPIASLTLTVGCSSPAIKGMLTQVSGWSASSQKSAGFLTFRLKDDSGAISGVAFDPMGYEFHKNFKMGATVIVWNAKVEKSKLQYQAMTGLYRLVINKQCSVKIENVSPSSSKIDRKMLKDVHDNVAENQTVDVVGIIEEFDEIVKNSRRTIRIIDESETNITVALWDDAAHQFKGSVGSVIAAKRVSVDSYNGIKRLRTHRFSRLQIDPQIDVAAKLKKWYNEWIAALSVCVEDSTEPDAIPEQRINDNTDENKNTTPKIEKNISIDNDSSELKNKKISYELSSTSTWKPEFHLVSPKIWPSNYVRISEIKSRIKAGDRINVVGLVVKSKPLVQKSTRNGISTYLRELIIADEVKSEIMIAIWGGEVSNREIPLYSVIATEKTLVREFNGVKDLTCLWRCLRINPEIPQTSKLKKLIGDYLSEQKNEIPEPIVFTSIEDLKATGNMEMKYNIAGVVVERETPDKLWTKTGRYLSMRIVVVADKRESQIKLKIWGKEVDDHDIPLYSIVEAKDVEFRSYGDEKRISCLWANFRINPEIPQLEELGRLAVTWEWSQKPPTLPMDFDSIEEIIKQRRIESKCNVIGFVRKIKPLEPKRVKNDTTMWIRPVILEDNDDNTIEMSIWSKRFVDTYIPKGSVMAAKDARIREFDGCIKLKAYRELVTLEPDIPAANSLRDFARTKKIAAIIDSDMIVNRNSADCVPIDVLIKHHRPGACLNVLAAVANGPRTICQTRRELEGCIHYDIGVNDLEVSYVKLIDASRETINMIIASSMANNLRSENDEIVIVKLMDVRVCEYKGRLELSCSTLYSSMEVNPNTEDAITLRAWYTIFYNQKRIEMSRPTPITLIGHLLENFADNTIATVMGILVETDWQRMIKRGMEFEARRIRIIDESGNLMTILLWDSTAKNFNVPVDSVILVRNFCVHAQGSLKWGDSIRVTSITENPSDEKNISTTKKLKFWFDKHRRGLENGINVGASVSGVGKKSNFSWNDGKGFLFETNLDEEGDTDSSDPFSEYEFR